MIASKLCRCLDRKSLMSKQKNFKLASAIIIIVFSGWGALWLYSNYFALTEAELEQQQFQKEIEQIIEDHLDN